MIWGIPRSKGGIVIRKAFYFLLCFLSLIAILAACAKTPQETEVVATTTFVPQNTDVVARPTIRPTETQVFAMPTDVWNLLILGDSTSWKLGKAYAYQIEKDVGVKVVVEDFTAGGLSIGELLNALKNEEPIRYELHDLPTAISDAEVIVLEVANPVGSIMPENPEDFLPCDYSTGYLTGDPPKNCNPAAREQFVTDLKWIWGEIIRLRNGKPTIFRSMDLYMPWVSIWNEKGVYLACTRCWENLSYSLRIAAEAYHIPFVHRYDAFNGVNHDEDPQKKGYIQSDGTHPSDLGAQFTAELLAQLGYEPLLPPTNTQVSSPLSETSSPLQPTAAPTNTLEPTSTNSPIVATPTLSPNEQPVASWNELYGVWMGLWSTDHNVLMEFIATMRPRVGFEEVIGSPSDDTGREWWGFEDGILTFGDWVSGAWVKPFTASTDCINTPQATYEVYITYQGDQPEKLRFELVGEDHCTDRQTFLDGQTLTWVGTYPP
jgi:hypothetical protein